MRPPPAARPDTCLECFRHPHWLEGRFRRSIRVFDDAGRLTTNPYAGIHLMDDLDTGHLPPPSQARNGYLNI